jgi:leader peptidase (prepilin peptidase)/N-methyltransferase
VTWALVGLLGLMLGSFFNVCIHRLPRRQSVVTPPSHCPRCRRRIRAYDNIPVLSWLLLRGRCRDCGKPISVRYPAVELTTGLLFIAAWARFGYSWETPRALVLVGLLVVLALIDLEHTILPFRISIPGLAVGLGTALLPGTSGLPDALRGAGVGAAFVFVAWALWRFLLGPVFRRFGIDQKEGMGGGDLPFAALIGSYLGLAGTLVALAASVVSGVVVGLALRRAGRSGKGQHMPFGPFLALGALVGLFFGSAIARWYVALVLG